MFTASTPGISFSIRRAASSSARIGPSRVPVPVGGQTIGVTSTRCLGRTPRLQAARQQLGRQHRAVELVGMRAFPVEDHAVATASPILRRQGGVQIAHAIDRQLFRARHGADARHQLAFGIVAFAGDHGAMQRQMDGIQPFGQRLFQRRLHLAPECLEHGMIHGARGAAGIDGAGHHLPAFAFGHRQKAIHLRGIAAALQDFVAAMDDEAVQPGDIAGKGMGFVENPRDKNPGHARHHQSPAKLVGGFRRDCKPCRGAQLAARDFAVTMARRGLIC